MDSGIGFRNGINGYKRSEEGYWSFTYPENQERTTACWANWFLAAEDEEDSYLGRMKTMLKAGKISQETAAKIMRNAVHLAVLWNIYLEKINPANLPYHRDTRVIHQFRYSGSSPDTTWSWAGVQLAAEGKVSSLAYAIETLNKEGAIEPKEALGHMKCLHQLSTMWQAFSPKDENRDRNMVHMKLNFDDSLSSFFRSESNVSTTVENHANRAARRATNEELTKEQRRGQRAQDLGETLAPAPFKITMKSRNSEQGGISSGMIEPFKKPLREETRKDDKKSKSDPRALETPVNSVCSRLLTQQTKGVGESSANEEQSVDDALEESETLTRQVGVHHDPSNSEETVSAGAEQDESTGTIETVEKVDHDEKVNTRKAKKARRQALKRRAERRAKHQEPRQLKPEMSTAGRNAEVETTSTVKVTSKGKGKAQDSLLEGDSIVQTPISPSLEGVVERMAKKAAPPPDLDGQSSLPPMSLIHDLNSKNEVGEDFMDQNLGAQQPSDCPSQILDAGDITKLEVDVVKTESPRPKASRSIDVVYRLEQMALAAEESYVISVDDCPDDVSLNVVKTESPRPKPPSYIDVVDRLEQMALAAEESYAISVDDCPDNISTYTSFTSTVVPKASESISWRGIGLAAEEQDESFFGRARQLASLGALSNDELDGIVSIGTILAEAWRTFSESDLKISAAVFADKDWRWSDLQLDAEDETDSIFGKMAIMESAGLITKDLHEKTGRLAIDLAKRWLVASSMPDKKQVTSLQHKFPTTITKPASIPEPFWKSMTVPLFLSSKAEFNGTARSSNEYVWKQPEVSKPARDPKAFEWQLFGF